MQRIYFVFKWNNFLRPNTWNNNNIVFKQAENLYNVYKSNILLSPSSIILS